MREKIIGIIICLMMFSTVAGAFTNIDMSLESSNSKIESFERSNSHNILGEYFTWTTCVPCKYAHTALKYLYENKTNWDLPFYYITYVYDVNNYSRDRSIELNIDTTPTVAWDGGWKKDTGGTNVETEMARYNISILAAKNRNVKDINLSLDVEWLGAVNQVPSNQSPGVPVEQVMKWNNSEFKVDVGVVCNETDQYNGHLHVQVTEEESAWWDDKFDNPYTFEFKNWAYNNDVTFSGGGTWSKTIYWDGCDYHDRDDPPRYFNHVKQDNIMVIATMFDEDKNNYVDEVIGFDAGEGTDPKLYDVYFGKTNPPIQRAWNVTPTNFKNGSLLEFDTTYFWKVDTWNAQGVKTPGDLLIFTTRGNDPPNEPNPIYPENNQTDIEINVTLQWAGGDPDFDPVTYDVYFGEGLGNPPLVYHNSTNASYDPPGELNFLTRYAWKIVAWDAYGYRTESLEWNFKTEQNYPPNVPSNPRPENGQTNVNIESNISWTGGDPNLGDKVFYDVYFGVTNPPTLKKSNQSEEFYKPLDPMIEYKTYYWKIISWDKSGLKTEGPLWSFSTGKHEPPTKPTINGPTKGTAGIEYDYTFVSIDPNNDTIKYNINWGDGKTESTVFYKSGEVASASHKWDKEDTYTITIEPEDEFGYKGEKAKLNVRMPRDKIINNFIFYRLLEKLLYRFPFMRQILGL